MDWLNNLWGGVKGIGSSLGSGIMNLFGGGGGGSNFTQTSAPSNAFQSNFSGFPTQSNSNSFGTSNNNQGLLGGVLNLFKQPQTILGTGLLGAGLLKGLPKTPPLPQSVNNLRTQVQAGGTPLGQQAQGVLSQNLSKQFNPLSEPEIQAALHQQELDQQLATKHVTDIYKNLRPGTDPTTDTSYQRDLAMVNDQYSRSKADTVAGLSRNAENSFNQNQNQNVQQALGASSEEMSQLSQLAQLDVQQIMSQLNLDYAAATNFKQTFQNLGGQLLLTGMGASNPLSLFGQS